MLRAATLPGADWVMPALARTGALGLGAAAGRLLTRAGLRPSSDLLGIADGIASLEDPDTCRAFLHTARSIMDIGGQRVDATRPALPRRRRAGADRLGRAAIR